MTRLLLISIFAFLAFTVQSQTIDSTSIAVNHQHEIKTSNRDHYKMTEGEKLYMNGVGLSVAGAGLTMLSMKKDSDVGMAFGAISIASGTLAAIIGQHKMIIEEQTRKKKAVSLSMADNGLGLAITF